MPQDLEDVGPAPRRLRVRVPRRRATRATGQLRVIESGDLEQRGGVDRGRGRVDVVLVEIELAHEELEDLVGDRGRVPRVDWPDRTADAAAPSRPRRGGRRPRPSSSVRSALRVTRNTCDSMISMPAKSSSRCDGDHRLQRDEPPRHRGGSTARACWGPSPGRSDGGDRSGLAPSRQG